MSESWRVNRREFMAAAGAVAATGVMRAAEGQATGQATGPAGGPDALTRPMRWVQLVLVETDPGQYDAGWWLDFFKRVHADGVCLSAGGCVCYYPTEIPLHHKSTAMKPGSDPFGELVAGCKRMGMAVIARTDPHSIKEDAAAAHPEWVAVDAGGNRRRHWATPDRWVTCAYGPYNFEFMNEVNREIFQKYPVDALFANRWQGSGMCYCESCKKQFREFCGMELPRGSDVNNAGYRKYLEWTSKRLFELWRHWDGEIKKVQPRGAFIANSGGGSTSTLDMVTIGEMAPLMAADRQSRRGIMAPWMAGKNAKEFRATLGNKPVLGIAALGIDDDHRWKDSVINEAELRIWVADGVANGLLPWVAKFGGVIYDKRWVPVVEKLYEWHWKNEKYLRNEENLARVGVVYSQQNGTFYGGNNKRGRVEDFECGMYQALVEARVPFEMVHAGLLDAGHVDRYKLLILPNIAAMSETQCEQVRGYVVRGGSLLATFETSLYDEMGKQRAEFGLADLFGVSYSGRVQTDIKNAYMMVEAGTKHPVIAGLEDAGRIIGTVQRVEVKAVAEFGKAPLTRIPSYPDLPMEEVYPRVAHTDVPEVFSREMPGKGRVVCFPGDLERTFWEVMAVDHGKVLRNAILWALDEALPATVTGPGMVEVTVWRQKESMTVHLVNLTNPMLMKAPYREIVPVGAQRVEIRVPEGKAVRGVKLLASGKEVAGERRGGMLVVDVESVGDLEVVAIEF